MKEKFAELLTLFDKKCSEESKIFDTLWVNDQRAWVWQVDEDTLFVRLNQSNINDQMLVICGVLRDKESIKRLKSLHKEALRDLLTSQDGNDFGRRMIKAVQEAFIHVDEHVIVLTKMGDEAQDDIKIFFLPQTTKRTTLLSALLKIAE